MISLLLDQKIFNLHSIVSKMLEIYNAGSALLTSLSFCIVWGREHNIIWIQHSLTLVKPDTKHITNTLHNTDTPRCLFVPLLDDTYVFKTCINQCFEQNVMLAQLLF